MRTTEDESRGITIKRTISMMRTIGTFRGQWFGVTALSEKMGLSLSTTHRYLQVFVQEGILERNEMVSGKYRVAPPK